MESLAAIVALIVLACVSANVIVGVLVARYISSLFLGIIAGFILPIVMLFLFQNAVIGVFMLGGYFTGYWLTALFS